MESDYLEAILEWASEGAAHAARAWLTRRGFTTMPMRVGLLVAGDRGTFESVFGVSLRDAEPPIALPVPVELAAMVASIVIPKPRRFG